MTNSKINYSESLTLPNNFLAEQAILNILLTNPILINNVLPTLKIDAFYFQPHRIIYSAIMKLAEQEIAINLTTVISYLQDMSFLEAIGGLERIITIVNRFENFSDLDEYIRLVNEKYLRRLIIETGKQLILWGYTTSINNDEILNNIEKSVFKLNEKNTTNKLYNASEVMDDVFYEMVNKIKKDESVGFKSLYFDLDAIIQGFQKSDLIIIAGRPSMGKTAFSLNLGKNIVNNYNIPLIIFTLEMSRQQIIYRLISAESNINANKLKSNKMTESEWQHLSESMSSISKMPIFIDDNPNLTVMDIRAKLQKVFSAKTNEGLVIIDYLQLMKGGSKNDNRVQEISAITRNLKILAKEFNIPIIVLSQLSRNVESRVNKRPMLSDLRESGCIANIAKHKPTTSINFTKSLKFNDDNWTLKGIKPTFKILLKNNYELHLTSNHKILTKEGWIKIAELNQKTKVLSFKKSNLTKQYQKYIGIKTIDYLGLRPVYDKTINQLHNYIKKGVILHNSIEQDADVVIMLYREEYYTDKNSNPHLTEFIIAKHRNGPIGTAKLVFDPSTTTFSNSK